MTIIVVYITGCTALGAWLGVTITRLEGIFPRRKQYSRVGCHDLDRCHGDEYCDFPERSWRCISTTNFTFLQLAFGYILGRVVVATVLLPAYFRGKILTAYQLLQDRFGGPTRTTASMLFLLARSLGDGLRLFLAATVLQHLTGWSTEVAIVAVAAVTVIYTFVGGMKAVIWTDVIQFSVYIIGAVVALTILVAVFPAVGLNYCRPPIKARSFGSLTFPLT